MLGSVDYLSATWWLRRRYIRSTCVDSGNTRAGTGQRWYVHDLLPPRGAGDLPKRTTQSGSYLVATPDVRAFEGRARPMARRPGATLLQMRRSEGKAPPAGGRRLLT